MHLQIPATHPRHSVKGGITDVLIVLLSPAVQALSTSLLVTVSAAALLPLDGKPALVWLEGPASVRLERRLLFKCYLAGPEATELQIVCLD
jgi:hypothetical protein